MTEFLIVFAKIGFVFFIIASIFTGISLGLNFIAKRTIKNINKECNNNYEKINDVELKKDIDKIIYDFKLKFSLNQSIAKQNKKINNLNKWRKVFHLKQKEKKETVLKTKNIYLDLASGVASRIYDTNDERIYLRFSENELFEILLELKERLNKLLISSKILWLDSISFSFILHCANYYNTAIKLKNKKFIDYSIDILNFFMGFKKYLSPISMSKYIIKNTSSSTLSGFITNSMLEILGKEIAVIYYKKMIRSKELQLPKKKNK